MKVLYVDMDNVIVDFQSGIDKLDDPTRRKYRERLDEVPGIFSLMKPMAGAIDAVKLLSKHFDLYILSTAPWKNTSAWTDKAEWVQKYFPKLLKKRLILSHHKNLNRGDYLIDDRTKNGAGEFEGKLLQFGSDQFPGWDSIISYLLDLPDNYPTQKIKGFWPLSPNSFCEIESEPFIVSDEELQENRILLLESLKRVILKF